MGTWRVASRSHSVGQMLVLTDGKILGSFFGTEREGEIHPGGFLLLQPDCNCEYRCRTPTGVPSPPSDFPVEIRGGYVLPDGRAVFATPQGAVFFDSLTRAWSGVRMPRSVFAPNYGEVYAPISVLGNG